LPKKYYWSCSEEDKLLAMFKAGLIDPKSLAEKFKVAHLEPYRKSWREWLLSSLISVVLGF